MKTKTACTLGGCIAIASAPCWILAQPAILKPPGNQTASLFGEATFQVSVSSGSALTYQWRFENADLTGRTNASLTITNVQRANAGNYRVLVTDASGSMLSDPATLNITRFQSIYEFGFSWTDTRGIGCSWQAPQFYRNRASNGPMWPEFLSTNLGMAYIDTNNYAHCGASASQIRAQVSQYKVPQQPQLSLYCLWLNVDGYTYTEQDVLTNAAAVRELYDRGARQILIESQFDIHPMTLTYFGPDRSLSVTYRETSRSFNEAVLDALRPLIQSRTDLRIAYVDMYAHFYDVLLSPAQYGFTETKVDVLDDPALPDKSFNGPGADYVLWNCCHPTSKLHGLIADWHLKALNDSIVEELDVTAAPGPPTILMKRLLIGRDYTLQSSPDLAAWTDLQTFTAVAGTNQWTGSTLSSEASYFRLEWQP